MQVEKPPVTPTDVGSETEHASTSPKFEPTPEQLKEGISPETPSGKERDNEGTNPTQDDDDKSASNHPESSKQVEEVKVDLDMIRQRDNLQLRASHLRCLHDFIITDLSYLIGLKLKIKETSLETITFEEVYHLYNPGDLIINRENDADLLYQVYAVTGGRMRLLKFVNNNIYRGPGEEEEADNSPEAGIGTWTDVVIDSFRMGWNGNKGGPRRITYRVPHYTGEKKITDLEYYPHRFRKNTEDIVRKLELRGKAVLNCYGHKKYDAQTTKHPSAQEPPQRVRPRPGPPPGQPNPNFRRLATPEKDLESDVYVDLKAFHQTFPHGEYDHLGRVRPSMREVTETTMTLRERDYHIGDHDVDEARSDGFLSSHFHLIHPKRADELENSKDYLVLLPHCVPAFDFRQREWRKNFQDSTLIHFKALMIHPQIGSMLISWRRSTRVKTRKAVVGTTW